MKVSRGFLRSVWDARIKLLAHFCAKEVLPQNTFAKHTDRCTRGCAEGFKCTVGYALWCDWETFALLWKWFDIWFDDMRRVMFVREDVWARMASMSIAG